MQARLQKLPPEIQPKVDQGFKSKEAEQGKTECQNGQGNARCGRNQRRIRIDDDVEPQTRILAIGMFLRLRLYSGKADSNGQLGIPGRRRFTFAVGKGKNGFRIVTNTP